MHANSLDSRQKPFDDTLLVRLLRSITVLLDEQLQRARLEVTVLDKEGDTTPCLICLHVHNLSPFLVQRCEEDRNVSLDGASGMSMRGVRSSVSK